MNHETEEESITGVKTKVPRIGFLGVGKTGKQRMDAIRESKYAAVVSLCDPYEGNTVQFCKDNNLKNVYSYEALLQEDIDGIVIATPNVLHKHHAIRALENGKSVFCQSPLACTEADAREVIEVAKQNDCLLMTDFSYRHTRSLQKIKTLIDANELGQMFAIQLSCHHAQHEQQVLDSEFSGGGCLTDLGVHLIDILYWLFPAMEVRIINSEKFIHGTSLENPLVQVEDYVMSQIRFSNGLVAQVCCSWNSHIGKESIIEFNFQGTKGGATFRNVNGSLYDFKGEYYKGSKRQVLSLPPDEWHGKSAVQWASRLAEKNEYHHHIEAYLKTASTLDRIYFEGR